MADGVTVTDEQRQIARTGMLMTLESTVPMIKEFDGTTEEAMAHYGLTDFINAQIDVKAADIAYLRMLNNILNERTFNGEYAKDVTCRQTSVK